MSKFTKEYCLETLKKYGNQKEESLSCSSYNTLRTEKEPSARTVKEKFDTWNKAKEVVGLKTIEKGKGSKKDVNSSYFSSNSKDVYYWIGFLFGDGSVTNDGYVRLKITDRKLVEQFKNALDSDHTISHIRRKKDYHKDSYSIGIKDDELVNDLTTFGIVPNKHDSSFLPNIPHGQWRNFVRGLFDADGHISIEQNQWILTQHNRKRLKKLERILPVKGHIYECPKSHQLKIYSQKNILILREWLYPNNTDTNPSLSRKKDSMFHIGETV